MSWGPKWHRILGMTLQNNTSTEMPILGLGQSNQYDISLYNDVFLLCKNKLPWNYDCVSTLTAWWEHRKTLFASIYFVCFDYKQVFVGLGEYRAGIWVKTDWQRLLWCTYVDYSKHANTFTAQISLLSAEYNFKMPQMSQKTQVQCHELDSVTTLNVNLQHSCVCPHQSVSLA